MFLHVTNAKYCGDYKVWVAFNDGSEGEVDLSSELYGEVLEPMKNWENGADFSPEFLREQLPKASRLHSMHHRVPKA